MSNVKKTNNLVIGNVTLDLVDDEARELIDTLRSDVESDISDIRSDVSEDIADIDARVDNLVTDVSGAETVTLWNGSMSADGGTYTLSESVSGFDFIDIYYDNANTGVADYLRIPANKTSASVYIPYFEVVSGSGDKPLEIGKVSLTFSGTSVTVAAAKEYYWSGTSSDNASYVDMQISFPVRIDGVRSSASVNAELADVRVGADGVTYASAGAAVRGQISFEDSRIKVLENELLTSVINNVAENLIINDGHFIKYVSDGDSVNGTYNAWASAKMTQMFDVRGVKQIKVSSYAYPNVPVVVFFSKNEFSNNSFVSAELTSSSGWISYENEIVNVPDEANFVCINGRSGDTRPITLYLSTLEKNNKSLLAIEKDYCYSALRENNKNPFAWGTLDKTCFSVRIDDLLSDVDLAVKIATDNDVPVSIACDVSKINDTVNGITVDADKIGITRKDVLDYCVANNGEILLHPSQTINDLNWIQLLIRDKTKLSDYEIRGCAVANTMPSASLIETMKPYIHGHYDYSDGYGSETEYAYNFPEGFTIRRVINLEAFPTFADLKTFLDDKVGRNNHYTLIFHSVTSTSGNGVSTEYYTQAIQYLKTLANNNSVKLTTWKNVYNEYGTTELAKRIKALEQ
jgi:hypothetical protein